MDNSLAGLKFDEQTQKELAAFLDKQQTQQRLHSQIHHFTALCWDKCVTGSPGNSFSRSEESCLTNCVDRFLDASLVLVKQVESKRV